MQRNTRDVTGLPPEVAISALCSFDEDVSTKAGRITPAKIGTGDGFMLLHPTDERKNRFFGTASGAVEVLLRLTNKLEARQAQSTVTDILFPKFNDEYQ